jgi:hypothetical protein
VLGPGAAGGAADTDAAVTAVRELVAAGLAHRQAAELVARLTGAARNELYRRTL